MGDIGLDFIQRARRRGTRVSVPLAIAVLAIAVTLAATGWLPGSADAATGWGSLPTPTLAAARLTDGTIRLSWSTSAGSQKIDLYQLVGGRTKWLTSVPGPATSIVITTLPTSGTACFAGNALTRNGVSFSKMSAAACTDGTLSPAAPTTTTSTTAPTTTSTTTTTPATTTTAPPAAPNSGSSAPPPPSDASVRVSGANLVDGKGKTIQLRGVNRPGVEYACSQMNQFISDPWSAGAGGTNSGKSIAYADTVAAAVLSWDKPGATTHAINTVRLPLNEECWLGINGAPAAYSGANYQAFVKRLVDDLTADNIDVILGLHWSAPGSWLPGKDESGKAANGQNLAPNEDHSVTFWQQVASAYKGYGNVLFDLFTEPGISCNAGSGCPDNVLNGGYAAQDTWAWNLYLNGGSYTYNSGNGSMYASRVGQTFQVAGTQQLVNTIRTAGSSNPIIVETLGFGNGYIDMMGTHLPTDPAGQIIASIHAYDFSGYNAGSATAQSSLTSQLAIGFGGTSNVTGRYPFLIGEYGTTGACPNTNSTWTNNTMSWADTTGTSYIAWGWDQGEGCYGPSLVTNDDTGATTAYGNDVKTHLQARES